MVKDKLGTKQVCPSCEVKFYDLNKRPAVCPKCDNSFDPEDDVIKTVKAKVQAKAAKEAEKTVADEEDIEDDKAAATETDGDEDEAEEGTAELSGGPEDIVLDLSNDGDDDEAAVPGAVPAGFTEEGAGVDDDEDIPLDDDDAFKIEDEGDEDALNLGGDED